MLSHLHALETIGTHINVVTATVRDLRERLKQALHALKVARASLKDVLENGIPKRQRTNIERVDLPFIEAAINLLEQPAIAAPKMTVPAARQIEDAALDSLTRASGLGDGPVARGEDFERNPETGHIKTIKVQQPPESFIEGDSRKSRNN